MNASIHILGAGSLGLLLAARLQATAQISLIRRPGDLPEHLCLIVEGEGDATRTLNLPQVSSDCLADGSVHRLIVCTKAYDALPAIEGIRASLAADAALLLMQNGMGTQESIADALPGFSVYAASTTEGAFRRAENHVVHAGHGTTRIGRMAGRVEGGGFNWAGLFQAAGLAADPVADIRWHLAHKLRVNALINPLTVLRDCRNGELLDHPETISRMRVLGVEVDAVLGAAGFRFTNSAFDAAVSVAQATATNHSSMLQDARAGRRLELAEITGYLLQLSEHHGVSIPEHRGLYTELATRCTADYGLKQSGNPGYILDSQTGPALK